MSISLSHRVNSIKPSATLAITARAKALKAEGKNIIGLGAGEPDFDTPEHIKRAAIEAIQNGFTKYTAVDGILELKQAICDKFSHDNSIHYTPAQILVSSGGKQSFFNLAQAFLNSGDEVIIPAPYWVSYPDMVLLAEAKPIILETGITQHFKITPQQLEQAISSKTRLLVINSPSNPTGVCYSQQELAALGEVLRKYPHVYIVSDDMYEHIWWADEPFANILTACPDLYDRAIILNGVSKAYSMTGWRIGYAGGPQAIINAMKKIQSQSTSNPCSIAQKAALAALTGGQECVYTMLKAFRERHDYVVNTLNTMENIDCLPSQGAFYSFPNMQKIIAQRDDIKDDIALSEYLLNQAGIAVIPGSAFGAPGYIRISFATSIANLQLALERLQDSLG